MLVSVVVYYNRVKTRLIVTKFITSCWYQYWEYSGIYIVLLVHHVADIKMIQNDAITLESVVEYCKRVNSRLVVTKFIRHADINTVSVLEYIYILLVHHVAVIKFDTEWCDYAWECFRILK